MTADGNRAFPHLAPPDPAARTLLTLGHVAGAPGLLLLFASFVSSLPARSPRLPSSPSLSLSAPMPPMYTPSVVWWRENGASLEEVQRAAGHADASTTKLYDRGGYNPEKAASFFANY